MAKRCRVDFIDLSGVRHSVELEADSVYEAAVMALDAFKQAALLETLPGPASRFQITVPGPSVKHEVSLAQVRTWASRGAGSPSDTAKRKKLREMLETGFSRRNT